MTKALTTFFILNLVATATLATLGTMSYLNREALQTGTDALESTTQQLAENLQWADEVAWEDPADKKPMEFSIPPKSITGNLKDLDSALEELVTFSRQRQAQLTLRYNEYVNARDSLEEVRATHATRKRELRAAQNKQAQLERSVAEARETLQREEDALAKAKTDKSTLESRIARLNSRITELNNELASLEIDLETRIQERDLAQTEYEKCRYGTAGEQTTTSLKGKRGKVLAMNPDWEYVVIDKGMVDNVEIDLEALVHRGNDYVGKLKIVRVEDEISVAEIVPGSVAPSERIQPGDAYFF